MTWMRVLLGKLARLFKRRGLEEELQAELESHLEMQIEENLKAGHPAAEARRRALAKLGGIESIREQCREVQRFHLLETVAQDVVYGLRRLRRNPAFSLTAILTLSLTTGALATVLTLAYTLFYKQLPVPGADQLVEISPTREFGRSFGLISYPDYADLRDSSQTLENLAAHYSTAPLFARLADRAEGIQGAVVTANFFPLLQLSPWRGRFFSSEEDRVPDRDRVAVLSYAFWGNWFGGTPDILGSQLELNGVTFTIIGVAPPDFTGLAPNPVSVYLPMMMLRTGYRWCEDALARTCTVLRTIGRRLPGRDLEAVQAEMDSLVPEAWSNANPGENSGLKVEFPRGRQAGETEESFVELLGWMAGLLLLVCCANLSGLLVARAANRARELSIRASVGASTRRLLRQLLTESQLLALGGGTLGIVLSFGLVALLTRQFFSQDSAGRLVSYDFRLQAPILLVVMLVSMLAGLVFGLLPALRAVRFGNTRLAPLADTTAPRSRLASRLVIVQSMAATILLVVAGLLVSSAWELASGTNFDPDPVALMRLRPRLLGYSPEQAQQYLGRVVNQIQTVPGVQSVSFVGTGVALHGLEQEVSLPSTATEGIRIGYIEIGPKYFDVLGTPFLKGRDFLEQDRVGSPPVAIVSRALARLFWSDRDPIGEELRVGNQVRRVVGLVDDATLQSRVQGVRPYVFVPFWQNPNSVDARLQIRVSGEPGTFLPTLMQVAHEVDRNVPIAETVPLATQIAGEFRTLRMSSAVVSYTALVAVLLSALGLYGSLALAVARRSREIGIRMAIGASSQSILRLFQWQGTALVVIGVLLGLGVVIPGTRLIQHLLYGSGGRDFLSYVLAGILLTTVGTIASRLPARRAARINPTESLKIS